MKKKTRATQAVCTAAFLNRKRKTKKRKKGRERGRERKKKSPKRYIGYENKQSECETVVPNSNNNVNISNRGLQERAIE